MWLPRRLDIPLILLLLLHIIDGRSRRGCEEEKSGGEKEVEELFKITLLHVNDIHSHFEEVNVNTGTCKVILGGEDWGEGRKKEKVTSEVTG